MSMIEEWIQGSSRATTTGAADEALDAAAAKLGIDLPSDYRAMMRTANGGDAEFGKSWIVMWHVEDLAENQVNEFAPGFTFFGSNGAGEAYAWDWRPTRKALYVVIPFDTIQPDATAVPCGDSLEEFFGTLHRGIPFDRSRW
jgi:hypothetical protein